MIQRIQSVFLVLVVFIIATLCSIDILHLVYVQAERQTVEYTLNLFYFKTTVNGVLNESHIQYLLILFAAVVMGLSLYILFSFKDRQRQMRFTMITIFVMLALMIIFGVMAYLYVPDFSSDKLMLSSVVGIALLLFCQYLLVRVFFLVKKDEALVRSADRIR